MRPGCVSAAASLIWVAACQRVASCCRCCSTNCRCPGCSGTRCRLACIDVVFPSSNSRICVGVVHESAAVGRALAGIDIARLAGATTGNDARIRVGRSRYRDRGCSRCRCWCWCRDRLPWCGRSACCSKRNGLRRHSCLCTDSPTLSIRELRCFELKVVDRKNQYTKRPRLITQFSAGCVFACKLPSRSSSRRH